MKTAVVFGVSGQDGALLSQLLLEKNYHVAGVSRDVRKMSFKNLDYPGIRDKIELVSASAGSYHDVVEIFTRFQPDEIYNLAGQSSVGRSFEVPYETVESIDLATVNILEAVRVLQIRARFFNAGSGDCFGHIDQPPATEKTLFRPRSPYGAAKASAFWHTAAYRKAYDMFACTGILFNHESSLRPGHFVTAKIVNTAVEIAAGRCRELVLGNLSIERDWGWAPEYVHAMWLMLQQAHPDDFILATGTTIGLAGFTAAVFERLDLDWKKYVRTDPGFFRPSDIKSMSADPAKAAQKLNWKARYNGYDVARLMVDAQLQKMKDREDR
jgi:GDPmannose 4,6-dehydratase